jgi:hypothetical protein
VEKLDDGEKGCLWIAIIAIACLAWVLASAQDSETSEEKRKTLMTPVPTRTRPVYTGPSPDECEKIENLGWHNACWESVEDYWNSVRDAQDNEVYSDYDDRDFAEPDEGSPEDYYTP